MALALIIALPFLGMVLPWTLAHLGRSACALGAACAPLAALTLLLGQWDGVYHAQARVYTSAWLPELGFNLSLRMDGLGFLFALLILGIGLLVILYARYYLSAKDSITRFYSFFLLFMGAMLGVVLSENLLMLSVFWELTSLSSFLLIGFWSDRQEARRGARMALTVTAGGGLMLLVGILLIGHVVGSFELSDVLQAGDVLRASPVYPLVLVLVLLGVFTKSAQFPFLFWLPRAMAAPTPVSAFLHSATMVKAGVFLLARLYPALAHSDLWFYLVSLTGLVTLLIGAFLALFQEDIKGLLAYSTISHLGLITLLFGLDSDLANVAALFHIMNHATFKASLFMAAGIIDHETGTRDLRLLRGLSHYMPYTAVLAIVASLAMAGVPLLNGFLSKEMFFAETLSQRLLGSFHWIIPVMATLAGAFSVAYSLRFVHRVFFNGKPEALPCYPPHEPPRYMRIPVEILVLLCLLVGTVPGYTIAPLLRVAVQASLQTALPEYSLAIWHGFTWPLLMSTLALFGGLLLYGLHRPLLRWFTGLPSWEVSRIFEQRIRDVVAFARRVTGYTESGSLQGYISWLLGCVLCVLVVSLAPLAAISGSQPLSDWDALSAVVLVLLMVGAVATVLLHRERLVAVLVLGVVGLMVVLTFVRYAAPDLALTQLAVEVVTLVLVILAMFFMPHQTPMESSSLRKLRDLALAGGFGILVAILAYAVLTRPYDLRTAQFFLEHSLSLGGGANVVNVILVDFRGFDTLGEIAVLVVTALGIYGLLYGLHIPAPVRDYRNRPWSQDSHPMILDVVSRMLMPLAVLISVFIFLRGHQLPGGGFIAGLITSAALILQFISHGVTWTQQHQPIHYHKIAGLGVLLASLTGMASWVLGYPFLTTAVGHGHFFGLELEWTSALLFDAGVYLAVVGATLLSLANFSHVSQGDAFKEIL